VALPRLDSVTTPAALLDGDVLRRNIDAMAAAARAAGVRHWPHTKTHKSVAIARLQTEAGAAGLTVATMREAEQLASAGFEDLLIAYPPVGAWRLERLVRLADRVRVRVVLDGLDAVRLLDESCRGARVRIGYLWEVECGTGRSGSPAGAETSRLVAQALETASTAEFAGLMAFAGHAYLATSRSELGDIAEAEAHAVLSTAEELDAARIKTPALSVGTTPTARHLERQKGVTEIRAGNYVFNDATQVALGVAPPEDCALSVVATVVARPEPRRIILDCGSKALAAERLTPRSEGFGLVVGHDELRVERLFEEHAIVVSDEPCEIPLGARLRVIPNHACATANLHERLLVVADDEVVDVWPVGARGWDPYEPAAAVELSHASTSRAWRSGGKTG
jgi:D-serine deaminase-like pyridoxal phosphate-dependent protein